ncbi:MAG: HAMP domain-containing histidine kinase [Polyangiaceae bacterium]|nr:HAMP domain-containing histidine kinase [Polyangiaceae bacterium]
MLLKDMMEGRDSRARGGSGVRDSLSAQEEQHNERFLAVRRRVFAEMLDVTSRKRLVMMLPFQVIVVGVLALRGAPRLRVVIQLVAYTICMVVAAIAQKRRGERTTIALAVVLVAILVSIANTGGLASPLLLMTVPILFTSALNPELADRRPLLFGGFVVGLGIMALAAHTRLVLLFAPLAPQMQWASDEYVALSLISGLVAAASCFKIGRGVTRAYERIGLELAVRREELCDESEGRTRALEGIAARLAHEVKNPLAAIKGLSTHVARNATDAKVKERLAIVSAEAERLQGIVEGFLSFSRGLGELDLAEVRPFDIARELVLLLETRATDVGVNLEVRGSRELMIFADNKKLRQAILNLVLNAMQASPGGSDVSIEVAKSCADGAAQIQVKDRGAGMAPEVLARIRKPYFTTKEGGSGLGIAIARGIIEQHGGSLCFESKCGRGTTATILLPANAEASNSNLAKLPNPRSMLASTGAIAAPSTQPE